MNNHEAYLFNILKKKSKEGNITARESSEIEFKEGFNFLNVAEYSRYMASFANRSGGYIIFGIKDSPRKIIGITLDKFNELPQEKITGFLIEYFSPEIKWNIGSVEYDGKTIGYIYAYEAENKPVICKKNKDNTIKNGEVYYRYRAQTRNIEYGEFREIIDKIKEKENQNWIRVFKDITRIGPEKAVISERSAMEVKPSSSFRALPVTIEEKDIRKFYPLDYRQLTAELRKKYQSFKENQYYHKLRKRLKLKKEYCFTRSLDPNYPKSAKKDFYSKEIIKEFDKFYTLK